MRIFPIRVYINTTKKRILRGYCINVRYIVYNVDPYEHEWRVMAQSFPVNAWYAAAWDVDIKQALFPRTICGKHVVMYRQGNGQVTALEDACWHRLVPLSKGRLEGDSVVCGSHGLKYNPQAPSTYMP